jgi:hypothetical protein
MACNAHSEMAKAGTTWTIRCCHHNSKLDWITVDTQAERMQVLRAKIVVLSMQHGNPLKSFNPPLNLRHTINSSKKTALTFHN